MVRYSTILNLKIMREVKIEELKEGDEIVISCQSYFKYLRLLQTPRKNVYGIFKSVKCSSVRTITSRQYTSNGVVHSYNVYKWGFGPEGHNTNQYINLECRQILLVKENQQ